MRGRVGVLGKVGMVLGFTNGRQRGEVRTL